MTIRSTIAVGLHAFDAEIVDLQNGVLELLGAFVNSILSIANGGTNSGTALSGNSIMVSNGTQIVQGAAGTTTTLLHGNATGAPTYAGVSLTADTTANQGATTTVLHGNAAGQPSFGGVSLTADTTANQGTTTTVLHGNAAGQPSFAAVSLIADVTGTLPEGNGGTNQSTYAQGDTLYASAANTLAKLARGTSGKYLQIGATIPSWATPTLASSDFANQGTTTTVLHGNAAGNPSFGAIVNADISTVDAGKITTGTLAVARGGTNSTATPTNGGAGYGDGSAYQFTAAGTSGQLLQSAGAAAPVWAGETTWTAVSGGVGFTNSWVDFGAPQATVAFRKDALGFIHLRGTAKSGTVGAGAFTLPTGYRPANQVNYAVNSNAAFGEVSISSAGVVTPNTGSNASMSFDGITFDTL